MTYVGGGWTLLASHNIWTYSGRCNMYFQVYAWSEQNVVNNQSTVHTRTRILVENKNPNYTGYRVTQDWSAGVTGAPNYSAYATFSDGGASTNKEYVLQDGSFTVNHDSSGNATSEVYYWFNGTYTGAIASPYAPNSVDISLPNIDRTAPKATISNIGSTYNTAYCNITVPFDSKVNKYSRDGKRWTDWNKDIKGDKPFKDTWSGLKPNTDYTFYYKFRRNYNEVWSEIVDFSVTTKKPDKPSTGSVYATDITYNSAYISWSEFSIKDGATDYYYQTSSDDYNWVNRSKGNGFKLTGLKPNTEYNQYVRIVDNFGTPSDSIEITFTTLKPDKPSKGTVAYTDLNPFGATFTWSDFEVKEGANSYYYQYSFDRRIWKDLQAQTKLVVNDLVPETRYTFYIRIVDDFGTASDYANVGFVTPADQAKIAYHVIDYQEGILTKDGFEITDNKGNVLLAELISDTGKLSQARVWYNDNGVIKKVKKIYYNNGSDIKVNINYGG